MNIEDIKINEYYISHENELGKVVSIHERWINHTGPTLIPYLKFKNRDCYIRAEFLKLPSNKDLAKHL